MNEWNCLTILFILIKKDRRNSGGTLRQKETKSKREKKREKIEKKRKRRAKERKREKGERKGSEKIEKREKEVCPKDVP